MSSGSYREKPGDIIDLDRYMRVSVNPSRPNRQVRQGDLVVDAGGVERIPAVCSSSGDGSSFRSRSFRVPTYQKRHSHDSGVSDDSYLKKKQRRHKRIESSGSNRSREYSHRHEPSSDLTQFRANCEQALLEQQKQIARLAELCEKFVETKVDERTDPHVQNKNCSKKEKSGAKKISKQKLVVERQSVTDSSDTFSSSRDSRDIRRKDHRSDSCKTYKIMLERLNDLSRVFANRRPQIVAPYSASVVVCNKLVATEPDKYGMVNKPIVRNTSLYERKEDYTTSYLESNDKEKRLLDITRPQMLDIAPALIERPNIITERIVRSGNSSGDLRAMFHLDDPIRFYAEGKYLQASQTTKHYQNNQNVTSDNSSPREVSLCGLCRTYWTAIRNRISQSWGN